jgi:site-specific DNA-methyltransferase (adenine-specific)/modification methylase
MLEINRIYNEDCLEGMKKIDDGSVDMILCDPPYNISQKNNFNTMGRTGVDFGEWDKGFDLTTWLTLAITKLKSGGNIVIFNDWKNMSYIKDCLEDNNCLIKEMLIWHKTNPMPRNRDRLYVTSCEFAIWATKGKHWTFNRQRETYENTMFTYPIVSNSKRYHPTQKPIELMQDLLEIHSNQGDIILDPFIGSGTTAEAAINTNRNFIGFELDKNYFDIANERINATTISAPSTHRYTKEA